MICTVYDLIYIYSYNLLLLLFLYLLSLSIYGLLYITKGTATHWPEYLLYNLETEANEYKQDIKNAAVPYNNVGLLDVKWVPLGGPEEADEGIVYI